MCWLIHGVPLRMNTDAESTRSGPMKGSRLYNTQNVSRPMKGVASIQYTKRGVEVGKWLASRSEVLRGQVSFAEDPS
jgi:hypothetical protein